MKYVPEGTGQLGATGQPAETLREGEEIAEIMAAAHGGESAREQKIDAIYVVERRTVSR